MKRYDDSVKMKFTDMARYIDHNIYTDNYDPTLVYEYLYHISNMLAHTNKFFNCREDYDNFAVYMATQLYLRLTNKKQFPQFEGDIPKLKKVKSILNYIKKVIDPWRVDYQQVYYAQTVVDTGDDDYVAIDDYCSLGWKLSASLDWKSNIDFHNSLENITLTVRNFLEHKIICADMCEWNNIYLSCLLSFLNSLILTDEELERLASFKSPEKRALETEKLYKQKNSADSTILFHLDNSMKNYVTVLTRELKHAVAKDISVSLNYCVHSSDNIKSMIFAEINSLKIKDED